MTERSRLLLLQRRQQQCHQWCQRKTGRQSHCRQSRQRLRSAIKRRCQQPSQKRHRCLLGRECSHPQSFMAVHSGAMYSSEPPGQNKFYDLENKQQGIAILRRCTTREPQAILVACAEHSTQQVWAWMLLECSGLVVPHS